MFGDVLCYFVWGVLSSEFAAPPNLPIALCSFSLCYISAQVNERGRAREERDEQEKQNGGLYEEAAPKQHRKPERTLRYTDTTAHVLLASCEDKLGRVKLIKMQ